MTAIALVLLVLGFLFATLQYPAPMKRFWKWALIGVASLVLTAVVAVLVINARDEATKLAVEEKSAPADISFDDLIPGKSTSKAIPVSDPALIAQLEKNAKNAETIKVEAPNGTIVEFPDGTSRDVVEAEMQRRFGDFDVVAPDGSIIRFHAETSLGDVSSAMWRKFGTKQDAKTSFTIFFK